MFKAAAKALTPSDDDAPKPRRKRGDTGTGFARVARLVLRHAAAPPAAAYTRAALYLADTLDWLHLWQDNADVDHALDDFDAKQDQSFPQP